MAIVTIDKKDFKKILGHVRMHGAEYEKYLDKKQGNFANRILIKKELKCIRKLLLEYEPKTL
jgi:hypothetical protein